MQAAQSTENLLKHPRALRGCDTTTCAYEVMSVSSIGPIKNHRGGAVRGRSQASTTIFENRGVDEDVAEPGHMREVSLVLLVNPCGVKVMVQA